MTSERAITEAERAMHQYSERILKMRPDGLDLVAIENDVRALVEARGKELMAEALKQADTDAPEITVNGARWGNRRIQRGEYQTVFGVVALDRSVYQQSGRGPIAVPLELRLGIVERRYTPKMARILTRAIAITTEHEAADFLSELGTAVVSSSTLSRVPRSIAARYEGRREIVEAHLRERDIMPDDAVTVQIGLDGVMVPQDGEHARPRGRKTESPEPPRHEAKYGAVGADSPAEKDGHSGRAWHEASVGTVAYFDKAGARLKTVYLGRMPEPHKATLVEGLRAELHMALAERPSLNVVFASDGAPGQWTALDAMAKEIVPLCKGAMTKLVDAFHVAEYVQKAAEAIEGSQTSGASILAATWRETIKEKVGGVETVLRSMRARSASIPTEGRRKELEAATDYIAGQYEQGRMDYPAALASNFPIGTGITEAAAKTVVGTRMKRAGARFSQHGGQTVMLFRTALLSQRFDALHEELGSSYAAQVRSAA
jgi:hypothetical protein